MVAANTADAVDRLAAWLTSTGDGLPTLVVPGMWDTVSAYWPRSPYQKRRTVYVLRHAIRQHRFGAQRVLHSYPFRLVLWWPLLAGNGSAEADQRAFDVAIDALLQRMLAYLGDKSLGGRFLSSGEGDTLSEVQFDPAEHTIPQLGGLRAEASFFADDPEIFA